MKLSLVVADANSAEDLAGVWMIVNYSLKSNKCFYGYYDANKNALYLRDDDDAAWLGGFAPGSHTIIQNKAAKLDCARTTVSASGNALTVDWSVDFKEDFGGIKNSYAFVKDDSTAMQYWTQKGDYYFAPVSETAPVRYVHARN